MGVGRLSHVTNAMQVFFCHWEFVTQRFLHRNGTTCLPDILQDFDFFLFHCPFPAIAGEDGWWCENAKKATVTTVHPNWGFQVWFATFSGSVLKGPTLAMGPWFRCTRIFLIEIPETCQRDSLHFELPTKSMKFWFHVIHLSDLEGQIFCADSIE